ncbi:hypothetical protein ACNJX9_34835 [Bradyrhizobium sp. DASA03076]|uniref:hypothetical protein n=1 Tax=Bradyrhizobium sp. BLXBL-03 TaxID=3395916 RepID=UPI003F716EA2
MSMIAELLASQFDYMNGRSQHQEASRKASCLAPTTQGGLYVPLANPNPCPQRAYPGC